MQLYGRDARCIVRYNYLKLTLLLWKRFNQVNMWNSDMICTK